MLTGRRLGIESLSKPRSGGPVTCDTRADLRPPLRGFARVMALRICGLPPTATCDGGFAATSARRIGANFHFRLKSKTSRPATSVGATAGRDVSAIGTSDVVRWAVCWQCVVTDIRVGQGPIPPTSFPPVRFALRMVENRAVTCDDLEGACLLVSFIRTKEKE